MAWAFEIDCPDCGYHWDGLTVSCHIGPSYPSVSNLQTRFCPYCYHTIYLPISLDRNSWKQWFHSFAHNRRTQPDWMLDLLSRIDNQFTAKGWYVPNRIELDSLNCPGCQSLMVEPEPDSSPAFCPQCHSRSPRIREYTAHVNLVSDDSSFG